MGETEQPSTEFNLPSLPGSEIEAEIASFFGTLLNEPTEEAGKLLRDIVRYGRWRVLNVLARKVRDLIDESGAEVYPVSRRFLVRWFREAWTVEDKTLQDMWTQLLASAATNRAGERSAYVEILSDLEPLDARLLERLCQQKKPARVDHSGKRKVRGDRIGAYVKDMGLPRETLRISLENLDRLGLAWLRGGYHDAHGHTDWIATELGRDFLAACQGRTSEYGG